MRPHREALADSTGRTKQPAAAGVDTPEKVARVDLAARLGGEHQTLVEPDVRGRHPFLHLGDAVLTQHRDGGRVQRHLAKAVGRLRLPDHEPALPYGRIPATRH